MNAIKILLADDDPEHLALLQRALKRGRPQLQIQAVGNSTDLNAAVRREPFDCLVLDYNLGDIKADDFLTQANRILCGKPTVVVSGTRAQGIVISSIRSGGVDFVQKDEAIKPDVLWSRVNHAISQWRRREAVYRRTNSREEALLHQVETDGLTGLHNRHYLNRLIEESSQGKGSKAPIVCLLADIDRFKTINDTFGHPAGDEVIKAVSHMILMNLQRTESAVRLGGEEFLILRQATSLLDTWKWAEQLRARISDIRVPCLQGVIIPTASIGIHVSTAGKLSNIVIAAADAAMYLAKTTGRDRVCTSEMIRTMTAAREITEEYSEGIEQRRDRFLARQSPLLGPVQREHVGPHSDKVSTLSARIGERMKLEGESLERVRIAAHLHDLGKVVIPEELLAAPRRLKHAEARIVSRHAEIGAELASLLGLDEEGSSFVRMHHERYDTTPISREVPLGARIICVADAVATMVSNRHYSMPQSIEAAMTELRRESGLQFAPEVVEAACCCFEQGNALAA
ncbi:MAG: diguanylate cyclase [Tepidisphaeraceae bacterium]|jgi:diguanylate cyclase (GGDEF)-like protein